VKSPDPWKGSGRSASGSTLVLRCKISLPGYPGGWLDINDHLGYELHADTLSGSQMRHRRQTASSAYLPGEFTITAVPENVDENVSVWVTGDTHHQMMQNLYQLQDAFSQLMFVMSWVIEDHAFWWSCQVADYQIQTQRELWHAKRTRITATVPRAPTVYYEQVIPGTGLVVR